jgi:DNA-binding MarR family transcriptional regulator
MTSLNAHSDWSPKLWQRYRNNLPRHLIGLSRHLQTRLMQTLTAELGHDKLRLSFEPFFTLVGSDGARLTELAEWLAISKQACNQTLNQIEAAGYVQRLPDPEDGRAKIVALTKRGEQLIAQGSERVEEIEAEFAAVVGQADIRRLGAILKVLYRGWELPRLRVAGPATPTPALSGRLPRISDQVMQRLMQLTMARGHPGLKMSYAQVLSLVGPDGGRIQQMAALQGVSKQAISAVAMELEQLDYIARLPDPEDARQVRLVFTPRGWQLLADSVASVADLEVELAQLLDAEGLADLRRIALSLYAAFDPESQVFEPANARNGDDLHNLARRLKQQLGTQRSAELARLMMTMEEVTP